MSFSLLSYYGGWNQNWCSCNGKFHLFSRLSKHDPQTQITRETKVFSQAFSFINNSSILFF